MAKHNDTLYNSNQRYKAYLFSNNVLINNMIKMGLIIKLRLSISSAIFWRKHFFFLNRYLPALRFNKKKNYTTAKRTYANYLFSELKIFKIKKIELLHYSKKIHSQMDEQSCVNQPTIYNYTHFYIIYYTFDNY